MPCCDAGQTGGGGAFDRSGLVDDACRGLCRPSQRRRIPRHRPVSTYTSGRTPQQYRAACSEDFPQSRRATGSCLERRPTSIRTRARPLMRSRVQAIGGWFSATIRPTLPSIDSILGRQGHFAGHLHSRIVASRSGLDRHDRQRSAGLAFWHITAQVCGGPLSHSPTPPRSPDRSGRRHWRLLQASLATRPSESNASGPPSQASSTGPLTQRDPSGAERCIRTASALE